METTIPKPSTPWLMLFSRLALFAGLQAIFALGFFLAGSESAWVADTLGVWEAPVRGESAGRSANSLRVAVDPNGDAMEDEGGWDAGTGPGIHHR